MSRFINENKAVDMLDSAHSGLVDVTIHPSILLGISGKTLNKMNRTVESNKIAINEEQAHSGMECVATLPSLSGMKCEAQSGIIKVDRSGIQAGGIQLVYPKKEKINWFHKKVLETNYKDLKYDTSRKQYKLKKEYIHDDSKYKSFGEHLKKTHVRMNTNFVKHVPGPRLPARELPPLNFKKHEKKKPTFDKIEFVPSYLIDDDPFDFKEEEWRKFLKDEFNTDNDVDCFTAGDSMFDEVEPKAQAQGNSISCIKSEEPKIISMAPLEEGVIPSAPVMDIVEEMDVFKKNIKKSMSVCGVYLHLNCTCKQKVGEYVYLKNTGVRSLMHYMNVRGMDFSFYLPLVRNNNIDSYLFFTFLDVYMVCKKKIVLTRDEFIRMLDVKIIPLVENCSEIMSYFQSTYHTPLLCAFDERNKCEAQSDPAVFSVPVDPPQVKLGSTGVLRSVLDLPTNLNRTVLAVEETVNTVNTQTIPRVNEAAELLTSAINSTKAVVSTTTRAVNLVTACTDIVVTAKWVWNNEEVPAAMQYFKAFDSLFRLASALYDIDFSSISRTISGLFSGNSVETIGSVTVEALDTNFLTSIATAVFSVFSGERQGRLSIMLDFMRRFNTVDTFVNKANISFDWIVKWLGSVIEYAGVWMNVDSLLKWFNRVTGRGIDNFVQKAVLYLETDEELVGSDAPMDEFLKQLHSAGKDLENMVLGYGDLGEYRRLKPIIEKINARYALYESRTADVDGRLTPFCICIYGESQIGKSQLLTTFADVLLADVPLARRVYSRGSTEHYDGYNGQQCLLVDDWASKVDTDYGELIDWVSCNKCVLPMADLSNTGVGKKGTLLNAKLILLATNSPFPQLNTSVHHAEAVLNRRHLLIECIKIGEFVNGDPLIPHLKFRLRDKLRGEVRSAFMNYTELIELVKTEYKKHMEVQEHLRQQRVNRRLLLGTPVAQGLMDVWQWFSGVNSIINGAHTFFLGYNAYDESRLSLVGFAGLSIYSMWQIISPIIDLRDRAPKGLVIEMKELMEKRNVHPNKIKRILSHFTTDVDNDLPIEKIMSKGLDLILDVDLNKLSQAITYYQHYRKLPQMSTLAEKVFESYELHKYGFKRDDKVVKVKTRWDAYECKTDESDEGNTEDELDFMKESYNARDNNPRKVKIVKEARVKKVVDEAYNVRDNNPRKIKMVKEEAVVEATADLAASQLVSAVVVPRMCITTFYAMDKTTAMMKVNGVAIGGTSILLPYHFFIDSNTGEIRRAGYIEFDFARTKKRYFVEFSCENLHKGTGDWCIYNVGKSMNQFKSIVHLFVDESELPYLTEFSAQLVIDRSDIFAIETTVRPIVERNIEYTSGPTSFSLKHGWAYQANTQKGDCGSLLVAFYSQVPSKFVGIHVCAYNNSSKAYSAIVTSNDLKKLMVAESQGLVVSTPTLLSTVSCGEYLGENIEICGKVGFGKSMHQPTKSKIVPSLLHEYYTSGKSPAILSNNDPRLKEPVDVLTKNFLKYAGPLIQSDEKEAMLIVDAVSDFIKKIDPYYPRRILTDEEMVNGFDHLPRVDPYTSLGYPLCLPIYKGSVRGKTAYMSFDEEQQKWKMDDFIIDKVNEREKLAKDGFIRDSTWTACLKDETVSQKKIDNAKTRVFICGPVDFTLLVRKYFGAFVSYVHKNGLQLGIAAGINPESMAWTEIHDILVSNGGTTVGELDYSEFDSSLPNDFVKMFVEVVNNWYNDGEQNAFVRKVLGYELIHTYVLIKDTLVKKYRGNPSGNPLTMILNSFASIFLLMKYYYRSVSTKHKDFNLFFKYVKYFVLGDDNIFSWSPELQVSEIDFCQNIKDVAQEMGYRVTSAAKDDSKLSKNIYESTFLKRGFRRQGRYVFPTLDKKSIYSMLEWVRISKYSTIEQSTYVNADTALRYFYFWGRDEYNKEREKLMEYCRLEGLNLIVPTYQYYDQLFIENGELDMQLYL